MRAVLVVLIPAVTLAACASDGASTARRGYSADLAKLQRDCDARGGMLVPMPRGGTGQASTDYYCDIRGPDADFRSAVGGAARPRPD
jgi:hypothetical protein